MSRRHFLSSRGLPLVLLAATLAGPAGAGTAASTDPGYSELLRLHAEWRRFETPQMRGGVPDYGEAAMQAKARVLPALLQQLEAIDTSGWSPAQRVDLQLVRAEMNGLDFNLRVLRPWARDPSFYVTVWPARSDVPARDAPGARPEIELYRYRYPLSRRDQEELRGLLATVPDLLAQARTNLAGSNARDLWVHGITSVRGQAEALARLEAGTLVVSTLEGHWPATLAGADPGLRRAVAEARAATEEFARWLEAGADDRTGPSGIGKDHYTWYQRNVQMVPYSWDEEVALLKRELERAHAALRMEAHRNRDLPALQAAADPQAMEALASERLERFVAFMVAQGFVEDAGQARAALLPQKSRFVPEDRRMFFAHVTHREPMLLYSHAYHWIDLARMRDAPHPSPVRSNALLSNIWVSRAEGFATGFEELAMQAGLYDDNPRARELVWIMLANRAARGLASLYVHANIWTLEEAGRFQAEWTPNAWAGARDELTTFEQLLYLRQPGYGTSYIVGKLLFDRLLARYALASERNGTGFDMHRFMAEFTAAGMIPTRLIEEELVAGDPQLPEGDMPPPPAPHAEH